MAYLAVDGVLKRQHMYLLVCAYPLSARTHKNLQQWPPLGEQPWAAGGTVCLNPFISFGFFNLIQVLSIHNLIQIII